MQIANRSSVHVPLETLWDVLNDVERVAPFVPGFDLQEAEGDTYRGTVKVKVGAITVAYNAEIEVLERDEQQRRVVMAVSGRERRGPGSMSANVTSTLSGAGESTEVSMTTDLTVTGRVAQFGSGVLADVSASLLGQFLAALESGLSSGSTAGSESSAASGSTAVSESSAASGSTAVSESSAASESPRQASGAAAPARPPVSDVVDLTGAAGRSLAKRAAPQALGAVLIAVTFYLLGRRR